MQRSGIGTGTGTGLRRSPRLAERQKLELLGPWLLELPDDPLAEVMARTGGLLEPLSAADFPRLRAVRLSIFTTAKLLATWLVARNGVRGALRRAAYAGKDEVLAAILDHPALEEPQARQAALRQVMLTGAISGSESMVALALDRGVDVGGSSEGGDRARDRNDLADRADRMDCMDCMAFAAALGHLGVVRRLLAAGVPCGPQVLPLAARHGCVDTVSVLLAAGAPYEPLALVHAVGEGDVKMLALLLAQPAIAAKVAARADDSFDVDIAHAITHGHPEIAERLLAAGADANGFRRMLLPLAAAHGHARVVNALMDAGYDARIGAEHGNSIAGMALLAAIGANSADAVGALLRHPGAVVMCELVRTMAAGLAAAMGNADVARLLSDAGIVATEHLLAEVAAGLAPMAQRMRAEGTGIGFLEVLRQTQE